MFNPDVVALSRRYGAAIASRRPNFMEEWPPAEEPLRIDLPPLSETEMMYFYRAAGALRRDIAMNIFHKPEERPGTNIPEPFCLFRGQMRRTLGMSDSEKRDYREDTEWIRGNCPERLTVYRSNLFQVNYSKDDEDQPEIHGIITSFFMDIALTDLYALALAEREIPPYVPGVTKRAQEFLYLEVDDPDLSMAVYALQDAIAVGLRNALRISKGKEPVVVPLKPVAPRPLCLLRGQVRRTDRLSPLEHRAYLEDIQEITLGQCDWDYIVITTMSDLAQHFPDEVTSMKAGLCFKPPCIRSEPNIRRRTETILTARKLLTVSIDPEFKVPAYLWDLMHRDFRSKHLEGAVVCLRAAIHSGIQVRRGLLKSYDVPDVLLPFPWTFHDGKLRQSANLGRKELQAWRADITAIVVGQFDFDQLSITIQSEEERGGPGWHREKYLQEHSSRTNNNEPAQEDPDLIGLPRLSRSTMTPAEYSAYFDLSEQIEEAVTGRPPREETVSSESTRSRDPSPGGVIPSLPRDDPSTPSDLRSVDSHEGFNDNAETREEEENRYLQNSITLARYYAPQDWSNTEYFTQLETDGMAGPFYVPTQVWTETRTSVPLTRGWNGPLTEIQTRTLDLWRLFRRLNPDAQLANEFDQEHGTSFLPFVGTTAIPERVYSETSEESQHSDDTPPLLSDEDPHVLGSSP